MTKEQKLDQIANRLGDAAHIAAHLGHKMPAHQEGPQAVAYLLAAELERLAAEVGSIVGGVMLEVSRCTPTAAGPTGAYRACG